MKKHFLIIDTSGPHSFVALWKNGELQVEYLPPLKQSQTLLPAIQKLLECETIDFIAVGIGPGSFTGTRVGVMTAKTLAFAKNLPLLPFCSLMIYTPESEGPFTIYTDARSQKQYVLKGVRRGPQTSFGEATIEESKKDISSALNLEFLATHLLKEFFETGGVSEEKAKVCYLKKV